MKIPALATRGVAIATICVTLILSALFTIASADTVNQSLSQDNLFIASLSGIAASHVFGYYKVSAPVHVTRFYINAEIVAQGCTISPVLRVALNPSGQGPVVG